MEQKHGPQFRIVGNASPEDKKNAKEEKERAFSAQSEFLEEIVPVQLLEKLKALEYPKSRKEKAIIDFANSETNRLMEECGVEPYDVPYDNYHIIPQELYKRFAPEDSNAVTSAETQTMFFDAQKFRTDPFYFGAIAIHETLHLKAHSSIEVSVEGETVDKNLYRNGVSVYSSHKQEKDGVRHSHFDGLHEAIVASQESKLLKKLIELPELAEEKATLTSEDVMEERKQVAERMGVPAEEIISINKDGLVVDVSYPELRKTLKYVCDEIQKQFPDKYSDSEEVFKEFLKANFTGQILQIARLVGGTFGPGSFRRLGDMSTESQGGIATLEALRKARLQFHKSKN